MKLSNKRPPPTELSESQLFAIQMQIPSGNKRSPWISMFKRMLCCWLILFHASQGRGASDALDSWNEPMPPGAALTAVAYGNGIYVAFSTSDYLLKSTNGIQWEKVSLPSGPAGQYVMDIAYGNGMFLATGYYGYYSNNVAMVMTSTNATDWSVTMLSTEYPRACAFGNGVFVIACSRALLSSEYGTNWTSRRPAGLTEQFNGVDFTGDHFEAVGTHGLRSTSLDGLSWSTQNTDNKDAFEAAARGDQTTVLVGQSGRLTTITPTNSADIALDFPDWHTELSDVAYGNGRFVVIGNWIGYSVGYTSTDGYNWEHILDGFSYLNKVIFENGQFIVVGNGGTLVTSTNGVNWTIRRGGVNGPLNSVIAVNDTVVAVGGFFNAMPVVVGGSGDQSWDLLGSGFSYYPLSIIYANGLFCTVGSGAFFSTSTNCRNWTHIRVATNLWLNDLIYAQGKYVAVGTAGQIGTSIDGTAWSLRASATTNYLNRLVHGNGRFVAVGSAGTAIGSDDGLLWINLDTGITNVLQSVTWGDQGFVAVGASGTILHSTNGQNWVVQPAPSTNNLNGVRYLAQRFIAVGDNGTIISSPDGIQWKSHNSGISARLVDASFAKNRIWIVGDQGTVIVSRQEILPRLTMRPCNPEENLSITVSGGADRSYRVQTSTDLKAWTDLTYLPTLVSNTVYVPRVPSQKMTFYRVVEE